MLLSPQAEPRIVNGRARTLAPALSAHHILGICACLLLGVTAHGCAHTTRRTLIFEKTVTLPNGRFAGPIEIEVPRRPDGSIRDFEFQTELSAGCGPLLRVSYPDGEVSKVGDRDENWQSLLSRRAVHADTQPASEVPNEPLVDPANPPQEPYPPQALPTEGQPDPVDPYATPYPVAAPSSAPPVVQTGHWQQTTTESWPGQLEFMRWRDHRCANQKRFHKTYTTAYDETGRISIWAEIPQEIANAEFKVRVFEITDVDREERIASGKREKERKRIAREQRQNKRNASARAKLELSGGANIKMQVRTPKPRPAMPKPKHESPRPAEAEGAIWVAGQWQWYESQGKWVWSWGYWNPPATQPAAPREGGSPPIAGCSWKVGYWTWVPGKGAWRWTPGYWNEPPPKVEDQSNPPVPESTWVAGHWQRTDTSFRWIAGFWGKPTPRVESIPPAPFAGARWRAGAWLQLRGKWVWSAGFYEQSNKAPPPRKKENPGASPMQGAVWLAGFWRWDPARSDYGWIDGHWETPPGSDYQWVADPIDPVAGYSISGQWKLRIDVRAPVEIRR